MSSTTSRDATTTLRLVWPQWQGATADMVAELVPELPLSRARRGYATGTQILQAVLPPHDGPTVVVAVDMTSDVVTDVDGIENKSVVIDQLTGALSLLNEHNPQRVVTLGGECSVSVAPFTHLAQRYGSDLAVVWIDSHPDVGTPSSEYNGYHAMAVSAITGHGAPEVLEQLPAVVDASRVALVGVHSGTADDFSTVSEWGISAFGPEQLRDDSSPLLDWLKSTGCTKVAIHLDVDSVDSNEVILGLGAEQGGLQRSQVNRVVADIEAVVDVVALTVAEFVPRQVLLLQQMLEELPLLGRP